MRNLNTVICIFFLAVVFVLGQSTVGSADEGESYLKFGLGGGGIEEIPLKMWTAQGIETKISSSKALHLNLEGGYNITETLAVELGLGYHKNTMDPEVSNGDGYFKRIPLTAAVLYRFSRGDKFSMHLGGGVGLYASPELHREASSIGIDTTVKYKSAFGPHVLAGGNYTFGEKWFFFTDIKYVIGVKYKFKEITESGVTCTSDLCAFQEWRELDGSGILFNLGAGYCF